MISSVAPGSRADEAGLRARDVILEVNRAVVKDVDAYQAALKTSSKSKIVLLLVQARRQYDLRDRQAGGLSRGRTGCPRNES